MGSGRWFELRGSVCRRSLRMMACRCTTVRPEDQRRARQRRRHCPPAPPPAAPVLTLTVGVASCLGDIITLYDTHHQGYMLADGFNNPELIFAKMPTADIRAYPHARDLRPPRYEGVRSARVAARPWRRHTALPRRAAACPRALMHRCSCASQAASGRSCGSSTTSTRRS